MARVAGDGVHGVHVQLSVGLEPGELLTVNCDVITYIYDVKHVAGHGVLSVAGGGM